MNVVETLEARYLPLLNQAAAHQDPTTEVVERNSQILICRTLLKIGHAEPIIQLRAEFVQNSAARKRQANRRCFQVRRNDRFDGKGCTMPTPDVLVC